MIIYPLDNYTTFISVADADTQLTALGVGTQWDLNDASAKEVILSLSTAIIKGSCYIAENACNYSDAQVMLIHGDLLNDGKYITTIDTNHPYVKAKVGALDVTYNLAEDGSPLMPNIVRSILSGCLKISDVPMATGFNLA